MKNPWLCVLDHRFPDLHLTNCRHAQGSFDISTRQPQMIREPNSANIIRYYASFDGLTNWLRFTPTRPYRDVIGTEVRIKFRLHDNFQGQHISTLFWAGNWSLGVRDRQFSVTMSGTRKLWSGFPNVPGQWFDFVWSWRVNGQSVLYFDRQLVASWTDLGIGTPYELSYSGLGSGARFIPAIPPAAPGIEPFLLFPADVSLVQLNVLTQERSEKSLNAAFPASAVEGPGITPCWEQVAPRFRSLMTLFRTMVADAVTQARAAGRSSSAIQLHHYAVTAAAFLARYLDGDDSSLVDFERALEKFLRQLKTLAGGQLPDVERQIRQILAGMDISAACKAMAVEFLARNKKEIRRLEVLLTTVSRTVTTTLEVNWHD